MIKNIKNKSQVNIILSSLRYLFLIGILCLATTCLQNCYSDSKPYKIFPANKAIDINPDTHLKILFHGEPVLGEDRDKVVVCYANNEVFNPHPANIVTNERPGTFP
ncbi:hypothetical protein JW935_06780, partial [candidate division KSB1 bacterium]|nr:hypothetical protein [candidate division KSB1 bacterium]